MTNPMPSMDFLLTNFTHDITGVAHTIAISADGLLLARSADLPADRAEQLAAIGAGLMSLQQGAATMLEVGPVVQNIVEMEGGFLVTMSIGDSGTLLTLASRECDLGHVGYSLTRLVEQVGAVLKPARRADSLV